MYEQRKKMVTQTRTKMNHLISCLRLTTKSQVWTPQTVKLTVMTGFGDRDAGCNALYHSV